MTSKGPFQHKAFYDSISMLARIPQIKIGWGQGGGLKSFS